MPTVKFTDTTRREVLTALEQGNSRETAAGIAGINPETLRGWMRRGEKASEGSLYRQFAEEVLIAEASARGRALSILTRSMVDQPRWAAWFLERRDPAFRPPQVVPEKRDRGPQVIVLALNDGAQVAIPQAEVIEGEAIELEPNERAEATEDAEPGGTVTALALEATGGVHRPE